MSRTPQVSVPSPTVTMSRPSQESVPSPAVVMSRPSHVSVPSQAVAMSRPSPVSIPCPTEPMSRTPQASVPNPTFAMSRPPQASGTRPTVAMSRPSKVSVPRTVPMSRPPQVSVPNTVVAMSRPPQVSAPISSTGVSSSGPTSSSSSSATSITFSLPVVEGGRNQETLHDRVRNGDGGHVGREEEEEEEVWRRYRSMTENGVAPTIAPCPSPVSSPHHLQTLLPSAPPTRRSRTAARRPRNKRPTAASVLRDLDPRVRFYVSAANANDYIKSGKAFLRSVTPVWHRGLLSQPSGQSGRTLSPLRNHSGQRMRAATVIERSPEERTKVERVSLNVEVIKLGNQPTEDPPATLSPFALDMIKDNVPGMDITIIQHHLAASRDSVTPTLVSQEADVRRPCGRSSSFGSATKRLGLAVEQLPEATEESEESHPVHPFLRMYQTRPGAFARLLARDAERKVAPGSTIASLMVPHPVVTAGGEGEDEEDEEFDECVQGTTIDMKRKKKRKKHRPRYILPPLRFGPMDWPRRQPRRQSRPKNVNKACDDVATDDVDDDSNTNGKKQAITKAGLHVLSDFPKQFVLTSHYQDDLMDVGRSFSDTDIDDSLQERWRDPKELRRLAREVEDFADMDYSLPAHLEDLLRQEGVDDNVVDSTVALEKLWHDRAIYLNHIYHVRRRKYLARPGRYSSLPPINRTPLRSKDSPPTPPLSNNVDARRERRENRSRPWEIPIDLTPDLPPVPLLLARPTEVKVKQKETAIGSQAREELEIFRTEADRVQWETEKQQEVASLPQEFIQPRLVLISSKVPRCYSMSKAIRRGDKSIIYIVYDFDTCTFEDLLETARTRLEQYHPGCKARSVLFMCQGAEGCLYMFHKIVLTPQKMKRVQYQQIKEFWKSLGQLLTKVEDEDTNIHLLGGQLDTPQGRALLYEIQKALLPNLGTVIWLKENTDSCREAIEDYFDFRKFLLWRSKHDSSNTLDYTDIVRSWSSLADEADEMDAAR